MSTIAEAASHIFLRERRFRELLDLGVITRQPPGRYDLDAVRNQYLDHLREVAVERSAGEGGLDIVMERTRLAKEQADGLEMKNAELRASLLPRDDVERAVTAVFDRVRDRVGAIPAAIAPLLVPAVSINEAKNLLTDAINRTLAELAATQVVAAGKDEREAA